MSDALLREIWESPADDAPRLVYADWLDDHGESERAELIRVQCRLAAMAADDPERDGLEERELDLLGRRGDEWSAGLPAWARAEPHAFRRGFVGEMHVRVPRLLRNGKALFRAAPLDSWEVGEVEGRTAELAACPLLRHVTRLRLSYTGIDAETLPVVLGSPHLGALRKLELPYCRPRNCGELLARWPGLARLRALELNYSNITDRGLAALLSSPHLGALEELSLAGCESVRKAGLALAGCARLAGLRRLNLSSLEIGDGDLEALASSPHLARLEELELSSERLTADGIAALAKSKRLPALRRLEMTVLNGGEGVGVALAGGRFPRLAHLHVRHTSIGDVGMASIARAPWLAGLRSLTVEEHDVEDEGVMALARSKHLRGLTDLNLGSASPELGTLERLLRAAPGLRSLHIEDCEAIRGDVPAFLAAVGRSSLRKLSLEYYILKEPGALELVRSPHLAGLRELYLSGLPAPAAAVELARSPHVANLTRLALVRCRLDDAAVRAVAESPNLPRLRWLDLDENDIGGGGAEALAGSDRLRLAYLKVGYSYLKAPSRRALLRRFGGRVLKWW